MCNATSAATELYVYLIVRCFKKLSFLGEQARENISYMQGMARKTRSASAPVSMHSIQCMLEWDPKQATKSNYSNL